MEPQTPSAEHQTPRGDGDRPLASPPKGLDHPASLDPHLPPSHDSSWLFVGDQGLRCGWSAALFVALYYLLLFVLDIVAITIDPHLADNVFGPVPMMLSESVPLLSILVAGSFMARLEHRRLIDYNLAEAYPLRHFGIGMLAGFAAVSLLVVALALGGWLHFGHATLHAAPALKYGILWAGAFLLVGFFEEGSFRCYLLATLTRGINFWWALATVGCLCLLLIASSDPKGSAGVFLCAALGLLPCWFVHRRGGGLAGFWQAAWATSTTFAYFHTNNNGENWIGIFAAGLIGFVFCVSVRVTGSAWWAIGCHTAWDWSETFFYGTPDSGFLAPGHLLSTSPTGNALWSGGTDGPEGSLLAVPVTLLLLIALILVGRVRRVRPVPAALRTSQFTA